jgi:hypothetical protein
VPKAVKCVSRIQLFDTKDNLIGGGDIDFTVSNKYRNYRNTVDFPVFPIGLPGTVTIKLSYKRKSESKFQDIAEFPITIEHKVERKRKRSEKAD